MSYKIYLVEDEENLNKVLSSYIKKEGWNIKSFTNGNDALKVIKEEPDIWVLDIMLPDTDGFEILNKIKLNNNKTPVIFISARDAQIDRVIGLDMGSDDYLAKPFLPRELIIRIKKMLERTYGNKKGNIITEKYKIDLDRRTIYTLKDEEIELTSKEFDLIVLLIKNTGIAFSREKILNELWGEDYFGSDRVVDDLVRRIRKKLPDISLETIYGYGYRMNENEN
ncbi:MAG TPA: response regulator transcription factor [Tepiditoga sp.]|nr:response regulator transcription factor [Thermotogota bacterium]HOO75256.1 response regulator transcription factor [Tepiditoga sp.]